MKNLLLTWLIIIALATSVSYTYYQTIVLGDFVVVNYEEEPETPEESEAPEE